MITRPDNFLAYRIGDVNAPPPLCYESANPQANWCPVPRPMAAGGDPGPAVIADAGGPCLGIDPTDPATWEGRGYRPSTGMISWLSDAGDARRWDG